MASRPNYFLLSEAEIIADLKKNLPKGEDFSPEAIEKLTETAVALQPLFMFFWDHEEEQEAVFTELVSFLGQRGIKLPVESLLFANSGEFGQIFTPLAYYHLPILKEALLHLQALWPESPAAPASGESGGAW